jgi:hypothetical protein
MKHELLLFQSPNFITRDNLAISKKLIKGQPRIGVMVEEFEEGDYLYRVVQNNTDSDCVGGVCPIR